MGRRSSIWIDDDTIPILDFMIKHYKLSLSKIVKLSLLNMMEKVDDVDNYKGINLKKYGETIEKRELRRIQSVFRTETMSQALFMKRVSIKIRTLITNGATTKDVLNILKDYRKEAKTYEDSITLLKNIDRLIEKGERDLKGLTNQKEYVLEKGEVKKIKNEKRT